MRDQPEKIQDQNFAPRSPNLRYNNETSNFSPKANQIPSFNCERGTSYQIKFDNSCKMFQYLPELKSTNHSPFPLNSSRSPLFKEH